MGDCVGHSNFWTSYCSHTCSEGLGDNMFWHQVIFSFPSKTKKLRFFKKGNVLLWSSPIQHVQIMIDQNWLIYHTLKDNGFVCEKLEMRYLKDRFDTKRTSPKKVHKQSRQGNSILSSIELLLNYHFCKTFSNNLLNLYYGFDSNRCIFQLLLTFSCP